MQNAQKFVNQILSKNKERLQKRLVKGIKVFLKKKRTKSENKIANNLTIFLSMKNKNKYYKKNIIII